jgi:hypothetical protein
MAKYRRPARPTYDLVLAAGRVEVWSNLEPDPVVLTDQEAGTRIIHYPAVLAALQGLIDPAGKPADPAGPVAAAQKALADALVASAPVKKPSKKRPRK